jgi:hypothetical protein
MRKTPVVLNNPEARAAAAWIRVLKVATKVVPEPLAIPFSSLLGVLLQLLLVGCDGRSYRVGVPKRANRGQ